MCIRNNCNQLINIILTAHITALIVAIIIIQNLLKHGAYDIFREEKDGVRAYMYIRVYYDISIHDTVTYVHNAMT